jgi:hypothetical protein
MSKVQVLSAGVDNAAPPDVVYDFYGKRLATVAHLQIKIFKRAEDTDEKEQEFSVSFNPKRTPPTPFASVAKTKVSFACETDVWRAVWSRSSHRET